MNVNQTKPVDWRLQLQIRLRIIAKPCVLGSQELAEKKEEPVTHGGKEVMDAARHLKQDASFPSKKLRAYVPYSLD